MVLNFVQVMCSYSATCHIFNSPFLVGSGIFCGVVGVYPFDSGLGSPQIFAICEDELDPAALKTNIKHS